MERNEKNQKLFIPIITKGKQIRSCRTWGSNRVFCRDVASWNDIWVLLSSLFKEVCKLNIF